MNPEKLFDYLDGRVSPAERAAIEQQLLTSAELQRELAIAREIHARARNDAREVVLDAEIDTSERGRKLARRIGVAFIILMAANVGVGLWFIAHHETRNPNRALLEAQMREQLTKSLEQKAAAEFGAAQLGIVELKITAPRGQVERIADEVVAVTQRLGGSATKGIGEPDRIGVLADVPAAQSAEFQKQLGAIPGAEAKLTAIVPQSDKTNFAVEITERP